MMVGGHLRTMHPNAGLAIAFRQLTSRYTFVLSHTPSRPQHIVTPPRPSHASSQLRPLSTTPAHLSAHSPLSSLSPTRKAVTIPSLQAQFRRGEPITMLTAHDFPSAHVADAAGIDVVLVGDSLAMVALGLESTTGLTLDEMVHHCRAVTRGARGAFTVGDLPMGSYEIGPEQALASAIRLVKEGGVGAVKLEGGRDVAPTIARITAAGIPVLAHVGLTPQRSSSLGGFRVQGKTAAGAMAVLADALAVQEAGAFAVVVEAVPAGVAEIITSKLRIPTIGIGAGAGCAGQVLVQVDMSGYFPPGRHLPKFVKRYGDVWGESLRAIEEYKNDVKSRAYPAEEHTYPIKEEELAAFRNAVERAEAAASEDEGLLDGGVVGCKQR